MLSSDGEVWDIIFWFKSMALCKTIITALLMHWSYWNVALSHQKLFSTSCNNWLYNKTKSWQYRKMSWAKMVFDIQELTKYMKQDCSIYWITAYVRFTVLRFPLLIVFDIFRNNRYCTWHSNSKTYRNIAILTKCSSMDASEIVNNIATNFSDHSFVGELWCVYCECFWETIIAKLHNIILRCILYFTKEIALWKCLDNYHDNSVMMDITRGQPCWESCKLCRPG